MKQPDHLPRKHQLLLKVRLNKYLSQHGIAARRKADELIVDGRVSVNGTVIRKLGTVIDSMNDVVKVDDKLVEKQLQSIVYRFYKPKDVVSTMQDELGRAALPLYIPATPQVFPVGRLDRMSEGLLILTNDGELALRLAHPRYRQIKKYLVWVHKTRSYSIAKILAELERGHTIAGKNRGFDSVVYQGADQIGLIFEVTLHEGIYHEVKRLMDRAGLTVARLLRTHYGPLEIGSLKPGEWERLSDSDYKQLRIDVKCF